MNTETSEEVAQEEEKKPELNLSVDVKKTSDCERQVTVTIPREDIDRYFQEQFDELIPKSEVPGFRAGKAPRELVESMFRKQVADKVKGSLLMDSLAQISEQQDFSAISEPELDFEQVSIPDEGDLTYEFEIEVRPEFDLPDWKGLSLERPEHEFTDDDVDSRIEHLSTQFSDLVPVEESVKANDYIVCDITTRFEGKEIAEAKEETLQVLASLSLADCTIDDFASLVIGAKADDTLTVKCEISKFAENEEMQEKEIEIDFKILDVKRIEPKTAEETAVRIGVESADELRDMIRKSMAERLEYAQRERVREQISKTLTDAANWELPPDMLRRQSRRELERAMIELRASGFSESEVIARQNRLRKNILVQTEILLKEHFILERIAEDEKVEDEPMDYELEIARIAMQKNDSPRRVRAKLERNGQMDALRNMIIERKVIALITEHAKFTATDFSLDENEDSFALNHFAAGNSQEIPEAKYDDSPEEKALPTTPTNRS